MDPGHVIGGKYRVLRLLGDGGMGTVYEAHHEVLGARVAIKVLHDDMARKPELVDRFLREARVLAQIQNPHVVRVLDIAMPEGGRPAYIVMELLSGEPLSALLARQPRLPLPVAVDHAIQILDALAAAHALGVIHRDLKPENVFVTSEAGGGERGAEKTVLKLIDFGIAKVGALAGSANLTVAGAMMGTPEYMAPEQAHSADKADVRSDLYAVGVMLYEMLSGARPVDGDDPRLVAMRVERGEVHPLIHRMPEIPRELAGLVHRAMAAKPELRFATAAEMRGALEAVLAASARRASTPPSARLAGPSDGARDATMLGEPVGLHEGSSAAGRVAASATDPSSAPAFSVPRSPRSPLPPPQTARGGGPAGAERWSASPPAPGAMGGAVGTAGRPPSLPSPAPVAMGRARRRSSAGTLWAVGGLVAVVAGGVAVAFAVTGSSKPELTSHTDVVRTTDEPAAPEAPAARASPGAASDVPMDPSIAPLPIGRTQTPRPAVGPGGGPAPRPSGSAPPQVASAQPPQGPLGPFGLPSSFPNPFPFPATSGVGPVLTIPTTFPNFGFPPDPAASTPPAPPPSAPPRRAGR